jgi:hypothetical protein
MAETTGTGLEKDQPYSRQPCTQPGFTEPAPLDAAGALLPHLCTLTKGSTTVGSYGGIFLWHYPHDRSHWALPSKFGLWGARTFLSQPRETRTAAIAALALPFAEYSQHWLRPDILGYFLGFQGSPAFH